ncbi:DUF4031 domain-containing protein [Chromobacterium sp. IIBBL 290-4]|uniref:DUF4031 domain-containing protein n=1 Tax=Chromobacterium sp. IIBBL 290-4 TaxID=2953890 RepID=UPI0020B66BC8|nr:DUF4031 domain-containing protein [Chromobacterium sp. IIBBL 290-4]UTH75681.1 DUF4031 domain-containing protein [Chromobacterium sp. IIBBL 290-4]
MTVYVDNVRIKWRGRQWCHLVADSLDELHRFAVSIGLKKAWFQCNASYPHYDITIERREIALQLGALEGKRSDIIKCGKILKAEQSFIMFEKERQLTLF